MKYLSPIGVCLTTASNTEQSRGRNCQWTRTNCFHLGDKGFRTGSLEYWHQSGRLDSSGSESSPHGLGCFCSLVLCTSTSRTTCHTLLDGGLLLVKDWKSTSESPLQSFWLQLSLPGLRVSLAGRLAQDLSGVMGVQDLCLNSFPSGPHASVQLFVVFQGPKTKGSNR